MTTTPASGAADLPEALRLSNEDAAMLEQAASMLEEHAVELKAAGADSASAAADCSAYVVRKMAVALIRHEEQLAALAAGQATAAQQPGAAYGALPDERAAFEAWIKKDCGDLSTFGSGQNTHYSNSAVNNAWSGWKARASHGQAPAQAAPDVSGYVSEWAGGICTADEAMAGIAKRYGAQAAPAAVAGPSDLRTRCDEILAWRKTGVLPGEALRTLAREKYGDEYDAIQRAERDTETEALNFVIAAPTAQPAPQQEASPTAGMNIAQRILHVGGRNNAAGYVEFGSIQAVEALVRQVLRDLPSAPQPSPAAQGDALDAARWHWLAGYLVGPRTDLDDEIVASETVNDLRNLIDAARAAQEGKKP